MSVKARLFVLTSAARSVYAHLRREMKSNTWCFPLISMYIVCAYITATWLKRLKCMTCESPDSCLDHNQIVHLAWVLSVELRPLKLLGDPIDPTGRRVGLWPTHMSASTLHVAKTGGFYLPSCPCTLPVRCPQTGWPDS